MPDLLIRNLDPSLIARLKERAAQNGRSLQAEAASILEGQASFMTPTEMREAFAALRKRFEGRDLPSAVDLVREGRDER